MILGFKKDFPWGEPTNFKEKILEAVKIHTLRADYSDRWMPGRSIQMCYRGKGYRIVELFNDGLPHLQKCTGVQEITIKPHGPHKVITIDGRQIGLADHLLLAKNDGFDDVHQFYRWFKEPFFGKIIHWTDYRY